MVHAVFPNMHIAGTIIYHQSISAFVCLLYTHRHAQIITLRAIKEDSKSQPPTRKKKKKEEDHKKTEIGVQQNIEGVHLGNINDRRNREN